MYSTKTSSNLHPVINRLLGNRGLTPSEIQELFSCNLKNLPDLTALNDIDKASSRIIEAIKKMENIAIFGDYDVDGTTSCALFHHFFKMHKTKVKLYQPSRFSEGYGLHVSSIDQAKDDGIDLMITVDCGITSCEAAICAKENNIDLIITDHHIGLSDKYPEAFAIVNPNRHDEPGNSPLKPLAGVGVAFAVCLKIKNDMEASGMACPSIYPLLQFVAIGTVCDLVKLTPMNLKLVRHGLKQIKDSIYPGILSFFTPEERRRDIVPSEKLSFYIGPIINSKGRLDHAEKALQLLTLENADESRMLFSQLEICNNDRKYIQGQVFKEAKEQISKNITQENHLISIAYMPSWHEGVIGIVASKLVDNFKVPAIVFTNSVEKEIIKASARSAGTLDIHSCLKQCDHLLLKFGGHQAAAGLSMQKNNLSLFTTKINDILATVPAIERTVPETYDLEIEPRDITPQLLSNLDLLGPFSTNNKNPIFRIKNIHLDSYDILKDLHIRWNFSDIKNSKIKLKGISFNYIGKWNTPHPSDIYNSRKNHEEGITIDFTLTINHFNGNRYIQLMVERLKTNEF